MISCELRSYSSNLSKILSRVTCELHFDARVNMQHKAEKIWFEADECLKCGGTWKIKEFLVWVTWKKFKLFFHFC